MTDHTSAPRAEISLFAIGATLLRHRWRIVRWAVFGAAVALALVWRMPPVYLATTSFLPQGQTEASRSGLAGLAGQFGLTLPSGGGGNLFASPDVYVILLTSRVVLGPVTRDTFVVHERVLRGSKPHESGDLDDVDARGIEVAVTVGF